MTMNMPGVGGRQQSSPSMAESVVLASYDNYRGAQRAVDYLSDNGFPVQYTSIIGTDLRMVEIVTGRMNYGKAALMGAASGAWFGLLLGLLFSLFSDSSVIQILLVALLVGVVWGTIFGLLAHAFTGGRRDFSSTSSIEAKRYDVMVAQEYAEQARQVLSRLDLQLASGQQ